MRNLYILLGIILSLNSLAQPSIEWQQNFGGSSGDLPRAIDKTVDGGVVLAGLSASADGDVGANNGSGDFWLVKLNNLGALEWEKNYGGTGNDEAYSVQETADGGFILAGETQSMDGDISSNNGTSDFWVVKTDNLGNLVWEQTFGGSAAERAYCIKEVSNGGYIVAGRSSSNNGDVIGNHGGSDYWIVRIDTNGNILWQQSLGGSSGEEARSVCETTDGGFVVSGFTLSTDGNVSSNNGTVDFWLVKLDSIGELVWEQSYGGSGGDVANSVLELSDGTLVSAGRSGSIDGNVSSNNGNDDFWIIKIDQSGSLIWETTLGGSSNEEAFGLYEAPNGSLLIAGSSASSNGDVTVNNGGEDFWIVLVNSSGSIIWEKSVGGSLTDKAYGATITTDSKVVIAGPTWSNDGDLTDNNGPSDTWVVKLDTPADYTISATCAPGKPVIGIVSLSTSPLKICADGSSATRITITTDELAINTSDIRFRMAGGTLDQGYSGTFEDASNFDTSVANQVTATFTHPTFLDVGNTSLRNDILEIYDVNNPNSILASTQVEFYQAPILFVHGLGGSHETFREMNNAVLDRFPINFSDPSGSPLIYRADYNSSSCDFFHNNHEVVRNSLTHLISQSIESGYSCGKGRVVGHSMGGLLARFYLQSLHDTPYENDIHSLVTFNTPHYGSQLANLYEDVGILQPLIRGHISCNEEAGALQDLKVNSTQIELLNQTIPTASVPSATISSTSILPSYLPGDLFSGELSDGVVSLSSQQSGIGNIQVANQGHVGSTDNINAIINFQILLGSDPSALPFFPSGFVQGSLSYLQTAQAQASLESISLAGVNSGQIYSPTDQVTLNISSSAGISQTLLAIQGNSIDPVYIDTSSVDQLNYTVPPLANGRLNLILYGGDTSNWQAMDSTHIYINSAVIPDSLDCSPQLAILPLGLTQYFSVRGLFGNNPPVNMLSSNELNLSFNEVVIDYLGNGVFQGVNPGTSQITFEYLGVTDSVSVEVVDNPEALSAAFGYTQSSVCVGDTISFENTSVGMVTGQSWNFTGGNPASSFLTSSDVTFDSPGSYDVSLVCDFINGSDTLTLTNFIQVYAEPDISISDSITSLFSNEPEANYQWIDCSTGSAVIGETGQEFFPSNEGSYAVLISNGTCTRISECVNWFSSGISIESLSSGLTLVPNPTQGEFMLDLKKTYESINISVTDLSGRLVLNEEHHNSRRINMHLDSQSGLYFMTVIADGEKAVVRLIKEI